MPYKILHIVSSLSYASGITKVIMNYYKLIDKNIIQFDFMYIKQSENNFSEVVKSYGGKSYYVNNVKNYFEFKKNIDDFCKKHKNEYSIIHLHMPFLAIFFYDLKKKLNAKAFILHAHSVKYGNKPITNFRNYIFYKMFLHKADYYFACSNDVGEALFKQDYNNNGFFMINIINPDEYKNITPKDIAKKNLSINKNEMVIGHVGVFHYPKNHFFIIDVFTKVLNKVPNSKLLLVGDGILRNKIEEYAKEKNVYDHIIFTGVVSDTIKYYAAMDVFLFPSLFEGLGLALIEAQALNIPCVASDVIPQDANINKDSNRFISLNESDEVWADYVIEYSKLSSDKNNSELFDEIYRRVELLKNKYLSIINN